MNESGAINNRIFKIFVATIVMLASLICFNFTLVSAEEEDEPAIVTTEQAVSCGSNISLTYDKKCDEKVKAEACGDTANCTAASEVENLIKTIINVVSALVGAIAVIMIIVGGFKFVTAGGDSNAVGSAKNTIIYAIVGLIIVAFAQVIVRFVLQRI